MALEILDGFYYSGANVWQVQDVGQLGTFWKLIDPQTLALEELRSDKSGKPKVIVYPNPVEQFLRIKLQSEWQGSDFFIYNINGTLVYSGKVSNASFDMGCLSSGYYLIRIHKNDDLLVSRFIKR
jgi:hypothetical protein